jgi:hypothetical protein
VTQLTLYHGGILADHADGNTALDMQLCSAAQDPLSGQHSTVLSIACDEKVGKMV